VEWHTFFLAIVVVQWWMLLFPHYVFWEDGSLRRYHAAEHKVIMLLASGKEPTKENLSAAPMLTVRCGVSLVGIGTTVLSWVLAALLSGSPRFLLPAVVGCAALYILQKVLANGNIKAYAIVFVPFALLVTAPGLLAERLALACPTEKELASFAKFARHIRDTRNPLLEQRSLSGTGIIPVPFLCRKTPFPGRGTVFLRNSTEAFSSLSFPARRPFR
jgi:uncharacterized protein YqhQ